MAYDVLISDWSSDVCYADLDLVLDEPLLDVGHHPQAELGGEQAGVLTLVLLEDVCLHGAADVGQGVRRQRCALLLVGLAALLLAERVDLLVDDRVQDERQDRRAIGRASCGERGGPYV